MSRISWTPLEGSREAAKLNTIFTAMATGSNTVDGSMVLPESIDSTVLGDRPVWERMSTIDKAVRNNASLTVVVPPAWATLDHHGAGALGTGLLQFTFVNLALLAGEALRFGHWSSWETTQNTGMGVVGEVLLRWQYGGSAFPGSNGHIQRDAAPGANPKQQHGQAFIEGWLEGPQTVNGTVTVQYAYAAAQAYLSRSLTFYDIYRHWSI